MPATFDFSDDSFLASPDLISSVLAKFGHPGLAAPPVPKPAAAPVFQPRALAPAPPPLRERKRVCRPGSRCGQCPKCLEDLRWERIFNEKFADPGYYGSLQVKQASTLSWVR